MPDNISMKKKLIMQSFMPLFLILFIKYYDVKLIDISIRFFAQLIKTPKQAIIDVVNDDLFITLLFELFCLIWIIYSLYSIVVFSEIQRANFVSQGESLIDIEKLQDSGIGFFMTYVLPMAMDDLNTKRGLVIFVILIIMLFRLMWKTNLYYQNPILTILGYEVFSFRFDTTMNEAYQNRECIGITRGNVRSEQSIKRQKISDNVFLIYEDN